MKRLMQLTKADTVCLNNVIILERGGGGRGRGREGGREEGRERERERG